MSNDKIVAVVATYNGERFIIEQMDSIYKQTRSVDEVLIGDDLSTDMTVGLVQLYIKEHNLISWKIKINKKNLGYKRNFFSLIKQALDNGAEYIFLVDQDDVWIENRVEKMMAVIEHDDDASLIISNVIPFYTSLSANKINFASLTKKNIKKLPFAAYWLFAQRPGCSYLIKRDLAEKVLKIIDNGYFVNKDFAHDCIIWAIGLLENKVVMLNKDSLYFRRHGENNSNRHKTTIESRIQSIANEIEICDDLIKLPKDIYPIKEECRKFIQEQKNFFLHRKYVLTNPSLTNILKLILCGKNMIYYPKLSNWLGDILYCIKRK